MPEASFATDSIEVAQTFAAMQLTEKAVSMLGQRYSSPQDYARVIAETFGIVHAGIVNTRVRRD